MFFMGYISLCALFGCCYNDADDTSSQNANIFGSPGSQQLLPLMNPLGPASQGYPWHCLCLFRRCQNARVPTPPPYISIFCA